MPLETQSAIFRQIPILVSFYITSVNIFSENFEIVQSLDNIIILHTYIYLYYVPYMFSINVNLYIK